MIGPILLAVSWVLLKLEGKGLGAIGLNAPVARLRQFTAGLLIAGVVAALQHLGSSFLTGIPWQRNASLDTALILEHLRWNTNSVLYEELLFRGYLLYQAIRWLGVWRGSLLGATAFGIYHWFSYGLLGNPVMMAFIFVFTGAFGLMLSLSFAKTKSIAAPIGLHLGWNVTSYLIFSSGPLGQAILIPASGVAPIETPDLAGFFLSVGLPLLMVVGVCWYVIRGNPHDGTEKDLFSPNTDEPKP